MKERAYAKINLSLDIVARREDGYHELNSIMIPINMWDVLEIYKNEDMEYSCNVPIPFNEKNTIVKAINYLKEKYQIKDNFSVYLDKVTPTQAGLGGGSADGAAAIRLINRMYKLNLSDEEIIEACLAVGADVPFTYYNKPAIVKGIGEKLEFINVKKNRYVLLIKPKGGVSTKEAYETLDLNSCPHPNITKIKNALENGEDYESDLANSLEQPAYIICPVIKEIKNVLKNKGYNYPLMSGSGSTVFVLSDDKYELIKLKKQLRDKYYFTYVTNFLI